MGKIVCKPLSLPAEGRQPLPERERLRFSRFLKLMVKRAN
jgi:hypothetical protein